jgi:hypothetical protein
MRHPKLGFMQEQPKEQSRINQLIRKAAGRGEDTDK